MWLAYKSSIVLQQNITPKFLLCCTENVAFILIVKIPLIISRFLATLIYHISTGKVLKIPYNVLLNILLVQPNNTA